MHLVYLLSLCLHTDTQENADRAAKMVTVQYSSKSKPLLTIDDAIKANSFYPCPGESDILKVGDANGMFTVATRVAMFKNSICDWLWENRSKSHIWYFENYQFEIFNPL